MAQKHQQQPVFQRREIHIPAVPCDPPLLRIHQHAAQRHQRLLLAVPPQYAADAGDQLSGPKGLGDVVVGSHVQPQHHAALVAGGGEEDHRQTPAPGVGAHAEAAALRQLHIHQQQPRSRLLHQLPGLGLPGGRLHGKALTLQKCRQRCRDLGIVLHQQDPLHKPLLPRRYPTG